MPEHFDLVLGIEFHYRVRTQLQIGRLEQIFIFIHNGHEIQ